MEKKIQCKDCQSYDKKTEICGQFQVHRAPDRLYDVCYQAVRRGVKLPNYEQSAKDHVQKRIEDGVNFLKQKGMTDEQIENMKQNRAKAIARDGKVFVQQ